MTHKVLPIQRSKNSTFDMGDIPASQSPIETIHQYHERTKHSFYGYAKGPETLDWDSQPNPFRHFEGTELRNLSLHDSLSSTDYFTLLSRTIEALPVNLNSVSSFLRYALGLTAWKQYGPDKWSLRVNPSSGNLHPTEAYLLSFNGFDGLVPGLFHYNVEQHQLEKRADLDTFPMLVNSFCVGLSSVIWRELWKYGERGFRYTQLDVGHAISSIVLSAKAHGWQVAIVSGLNSEKLSDLLGLNRAEYSSVEKEIPECLLLIGNGIVEDAVDAFQFNSLVPSNWCGSPNLLGERSPYKWPWADIAVYASREISNNLALKPISETVASATNSGEVTALSFQQTAKQRRSAQAFNKASVTLEHFKILTQALFNFGQPLFDESRPSIDFVIMVHRVDDLQPGVYLMPSLQDNLAELKKAFTKWSDWVEISGFGEDQTSLYQLTAANVQKATATLCCQQAIASECAFTIGFLAPVDNVTNRLGASAYRHLFWQAGMLSHQLYMAATALNLAATGIGCFFDDPWLGLLGEEPTDYNIVYATALGIPLSDQRITSFSGYHHLPERAVVNS